MDPFNNPFNKDRDQHINHTRDEAIKKATIHADRQWYDAAYSIGVTLSKTLNELISEDIFDQIPAGLTTHEPRAMGGVMRALKAAGHIEPTDRYVKSPSMVGHGRPSRVWKCLN